MRYRKQNAWLAIFLFFTFFVTNIFSQNNLKKIIEAGINSEQLKKDSVFRLIRVTGNDTLRADRYIEYFELSDEKEWLKYAPLAIREIDSVIRVKKPKTQILNALLNKKAFLKRYVSYAYMGSGFDKEKKALKELDESIEIFKQTDNNTEACQTYVNKAQIYAKQGDLLKELQTLEEGLKYAVESKYNRGISRFYVQLQIFYADIGDTTQALSYLEKAIDLEKIIADPTREARGYYLVGITYSGMNKHKEAIEYFLHSLQSYQKQNMQQKDRIGQTYYALGNEYTTIKEYEKAIKIYDEAIEVTTQNNDTRTLFFCSLAKGKVRSMQGKKEEALKIHSDLLKLAKELNALDGVGKWIYLEIARDYYNSKEYADAKRNMDIANRYIGDEPVDDLFDMESLSYKIDSSLNFYEGAYRHYYKMNFLKEKMNKENVIKSLAAEKFRAEVSNLKNEQDKQNAISNEEKKRQRVITFAVAGVLFIVIIFSVFLFNRFRITKRQKIMIEEQKELVDQAYAQLHERNKEVMDSINYASRIQRALLPSDRNVHIHFQRLNKTWK